MVLAQRFVQRWDLHARQLDDGSYICVHEPLNVGHLAKALAEEDNPPYLERSRRGGHLWLFLGEDQLNHPGQVAQKGSEECSKA